MFKNLLEFAEEGVLSFTGGGGCEAFVNHYATEGFLSPHCKIQHVQYMHVRLVETVWIGTEKPGIDLLQSTAERTLLKEI